MSAPPKSASRRAPARRRGRSTCGEPTRIAELLGRSGSVLERLSSAARERARLDREFAAVVAQPMAGHLHVCSVRDGRVTVAADSPEWGHRARYQAPELLDLLRERGARPELRELRVVVRPEPSARPTPAPRPAPRLSSTTAALLEHVARSLDNPRLARSLRRLAQHRRGNR